ncbi:MAG: alpha/beta fold hydrolase [Erythrobacter sp.]
MAATAIRIILGMAAAYLIALLALYFAQSRFIYPAPQDRHEPALGFQEVVLRTGDGLDLNAHWKPPEAKQPTAVFFHGNGGSLAGATRETQLLAVQGYGLLLVNYRGYGGNPGEPSEQGFYNDGRAAMAFVKGQRVTPEQTIIIGNSIGTGTAMQMAVEHDPAALILTAPFTSLTDVAAEALPIFPVRSLLRDEFNNAQKLSGYDGKVLIQHGTVDKVVPYKFGKRLSGVNETSRFETFEGAGHDLSFLEQAQIQQSEWLSAIGL